MPSAAPEKVRRSRITAACAVCRGKRQKCSGEKPVCDQCRQHNEECWWSETKKRGPAKDYLRSLQDRLQETERLLIGVLGRVNDSDLLDVVQNDVNSIQGPSHQTWSSNMSGQEHWSIYPLTRLDTIRAWEGARRAYTPGIKSEQRTVYDPTLEAGTRATYARQEVSSPVSMSIHGGNAPPGTAMSQINNEEHFRSYSTASLHGRNDSWSATEGNRMERDDGRRYSEETREAGEALFSISNHMRAAQQQQQQHSRQEAQQQTSLQHNIPHPPMQAQMQPTSQPWQTSRHEGKAAVTTGMDNTQTDFPKHLFW